MPCGHVQCVAARSSWAVSACTAKARTRTRRLLRRRSGLFPTAVSDDLGERLTAMDNWSAEEADRWRELEGRYIALAQADDLADNYITPYIRARPDDFPETIDRL